MSEENVWAIMAACSVIPIVGGLLLGEITWKQDADRLFSENYLVQEIGGLETLGVTSRKNLDGVSDTVSSGVPAHELVLHLKEMGFTEPKGHCGWLDAPERKDLADYTACYIYAPSIRNCEIFYMIAVKYDDAKYATNIIGTHFVTSTCFMKFSKEEK